MSSIDNRIVQMELDNRDFLRNVNQTNDSLDSLKNHLQMDGATKGLNDIQNTANGMDLGALASGVDRIQRAFSVLGIIGINVLSRLTQEALTFIGSVGAKILDPIVEGGMRRALNIEQARFQLKGLGLDVEKAMEAALGAVKNTAFGLDEAAKAASNLAASQVPLEKMQGVLRGIAGVAAMTGSGYSDIADVFQKVAGQGRLMGDDLLRLASRGLNAAAILGKALGKSEADIRKMVTEGEISFETFSDAMTKAFGEHAVKANETYTGSLSNLRSALARIGATVATPTFEALRKVINATTPTVDMIHEALKPLLNTFTQMADERANGLVEFLTQLNQSKVPGALMMGVKQLLGLFTSIVDIIENAFGEIFPPVTVEGIYNAIRAINQFIHSLRPSKEEAEDLKNIFAGFFALINIGWQIISRVFKLVANLLGVMTGGSGGVLHLAGSVGELLVQFNDFLTTGEGLDKFFKGLERVLTRPIELLKLFGEAIEFVVLAVKNLVRGNSLTDFGEDLSSRFSGFVKLGEFLTRVWEGLKNVVETLLNVLAPMAAIVKRIADEIGERVGKAFDNLTFDQSIDAINTGLLAGFVAILWSLVGRVQGLFQGIGIAIVSQMNLTLGALRVNLQALSMNLNAKTLKEIALAIALLAASALALSLVDPARLATSLGAMTVLIAELMGTMAIMVKVMTDKNLLMLPVVTFALQGLAVALLILAGAVAILSAVPLENLIAGVAALTILLAALVAATHLMSSRGPGILIAAWALQTLAFAMVILSGAVAALGAIPLENLIQGITAFTILLAQMVAVTALLAKGGPRTVAAAGAMLILAVAMNIMAGAVASLGSINLETLIIGLAALAATLLIMVLAMKFMTASIPGAIAMVIAAAAIMVLANALKIMATMSWDEIGRTMVVLAGGLLILAAALIAFNFGIVGSIALMVASVALIAFASALKIMATMSWDDIGRTMVVLAGGLLILAAAAIIFTAGIAGAAAMVIVAGAMMILAPALKLLGTMSWDDIGRGLTVLAAALAILAVMGVLLIPGVGALIGLGFAVVLLGTGVFLAATGISLLAVALSVLVAVGTPALALMVKGIQAFASQIPLLALQIGKGIIEIAAYLGENAPILIGAFVQILLAMLDAIGQVIPAIIETATKIIVAFVEALVILIPLLVDAGLRIINGVLEGIANNIQRTVELGIQIVTNFMDGIANELPNLIQSGINLIISYINALAQGIEDNIDKINRATSRLVVAIADGVAAAIRSNSAAIRRAGEKIGAALLDGAKSLLGIASPSKEFAKVGTFVVQGLTNRLSKLGRNVEKSGEDLGDHALTGLKKTVSQIGKAIDSEVDVNPTIRPVLDLSDIRKNAGEISGLLSVNDPRLSLDGVTANVSAANAGYEQNMRVATDADGEPRGDGATIHFTQINQSPKALSNVEIYRQTRSQLAVAKGEMDKYAD